MSQRRVATTLHPACRLHPSTAIVSVANVAASTAQDRTVVRLPPSPSACDALSGPTAAPVASAAANIAAAATNASGAGCRGSPSADSSTPRPYVVPRRVPDSARFFCRIHP